MDYSSQLKTCGVYGAQISTRDLLLTKPAVYAFFDSFRFDTKPIEDAIDKFKTRHARSLRTDDTALPFYFKVLFRGNPDPFKGEGLKLCKAIDPANVGTVSTTLAFLSILNEPLYIGKAKDMRDRFRVHHEKDFLHRMKSEYQRPCEEFVLFAYYCDYEFVRLIESVLIQLINPPFCDQKS